MPYNGVKIRQLMGGRKYIRIAYWDSDNNQFGWNFKGKITPTLKYEGESRKMETGEIKWKNDGFRFSGKVDIYNLISDDEIDILSLNAALNSHKCGSGILWIYPYFDDTLLADSQNKYQIYESGDRTPAYLHEFLPDAQVFGYNFTGVLIDSGILKTVDDGTAVQSGSGGYYGTIL